MKEQGFLQEGGGIRLRGKSSLVGVQLRLDLRRRSNSDFQGSLRGRRRVSKPGRWSLERESRARGTP